MMRRRYTRAQVNKLKKFRSLGIVIFMAAMVLGAFIGLLFFARPKTSDAEKRELEKFPSFTVTTFLDGSYFEQVSLWYSDTYPTREAMVSLSQKFKKMYGIQMGSQMIGGDVTADDIPTVDSDDNTSADDSSDETTENTTETVTEDPEMGLMVSNQEIDSEDASTGAESTVTVSIYLDDDNSAADEVEPPDSLAMDEAFKKQLQSNLYVKSGVAYSLYYFVQDSATEYIETLNYAAAQLSGQTNVYSILVPNNSGVMLTDKELKKLGGSDQDQAIEYYYSQMQGVKTVDIYETLREHNDEYLYFRSDHHWTADGAYYAYEDFCKVKGITAISRESRKKDTFEGFLGSFYNTLQNADMENNPDTVYAYEPIGTNDMTYWNSDGSEQAWNVVRDVEGWDSGSLYSTFVGGDKPLAIIENPTITDGSSCLVLKESYGNAFIPFLVDHYQTIYIIDYRYSKVNVLQYVKEKKVDDLICINNISIIGDTDVVSTISGLLH
jgi:hypothetical protein